MNYYYKDNLGNYYNLKQERQDLIPITKEEWDESQQQIANKQQINKQIANYKKLLSQTDYQAIKYAEGVLTEEEYAPIKAQRQEWRNAINNLQEGAN